MNKISNQRFTFSLSFVNLGDYKAVMRPLMLKISMGILCLLQMGSAWAQEARVVQWSQVEEILKQSSDTTYVLNFWATWCQPCVAEMPDFEELNKRYADQKVKVLLISIDFAQDLTKRVQPFIQKYQLRSHVWLLNEPDYNSWIDKIHAQWSGAIPATLILNNQKGRKTFLEQKLSYERLREELIPFL